jgi:hypothetical protein
MLKETDFLFDIKMLENFVLEFNQIFALPTLHVAFDKLSEINIFLSFAKRTKPVHS